MKCLIELQKDVIDYSKAIISTYPAETRNNLTNDWKTYLFTNNDDLKNSATGTKNSIKLDGTFQLYKSGFVDILRSDSVGNVGSKINITFEYPVNIFEIDIEFGYVFATNLSIGFEHGTAITSKQFENSSQHCKIEYTDTNVTSLYFSFDKVNVANDFLQIKSINIKENIELSDDDISNLTLYNRHNLLCDEVRQGEAKIEIINANEKFNILNDSNKNYYSLMQKNQKVIIYDDNNVKIGTFFIDNMTNSDDTGIATLYCNDVTTFLSKEFKNSIFGTYKFEDWLKDIFAKCDYNFNYEISSELKNDVAHYGYNNADKCKDALIYLCISYNANFIIKNDGTLYFYKQNNSLANSSYAGDIKNYIPRLSNTKYEIEVDYVTKFSKTASNEYVNVGNELSLGKYNFYLTNSSYNLLGENQSKPNKFIPEKVESFNLGNESAITITVKDFKSKLDYAEFEITKIVGVPVECNLKFSGNNLDADYCTAYSHTQNATDRQKISNNCLIYDLVSAEDIVEHRVDYYNMFNCEIEYTVINPDLTKLKVGYAYYITISNNKNFNHFITEIEYNAKTSTATVRGLGYVILGN